MIHQILARHKAAPRTVADLEAELQRHNFVLLEAKRGRSAARVKIPDCMAAGDTEGIENCRKEIARLDAQVRDFTDRREQTEDAIRAAKERDRAAQAAQDYGVIRRQVAAFKTSAFRTADSLEAFAKAYMQMLAQQEAMESAMRSAGISPDPYVIRSKLKALTDMSLYLETDGAFGEGHTLHSPHELRKSGRADLKRAANDAHELYMRQVRHKLEVTDQPPEAA